MPAEELEGDVVLTGAGGDAASLYISFQHIHIPKHRKNWLKKKKKIGAEVTPWAALQ